LERNKFQVILSFSMSDYITFGRRSNVNMWVTKGAKCITLPSIASVYPLKLWFPIFLVGTEISFPFCIRLNGWSCRSRNWPLSYHWTFFQNDFVKGIVKTTLKLTWQVQKKSFTNRDLDINNDRQKQRDGKILRIAVQLKSGNLFSQKCMYPVCVIGQKSMYYMRKACELATMIPNENGAIARGCNHAQSIGNVSISKFPYYVWKAVL
jgi:hypothetical protein